jgi:hypothetical protein
MKLNRFAARLLGSPATRSAKNLLLEGMRIGGRSPERAGASRPHYLPRDP